MSHQRREETLQRNLVRHDGNDIAKFKCPHSDCKNSQYVFATKTSLSRHIKTAHTNHMKKKCPFCGKTYSNLFVMHRHVKKFHPTEMDAEGSEIQCQQEACLQKCTGFQDYLEHLRSGHSKKSYFNYETMQLKTGPIQCTKCNKVINNIAFYKSHMKLHEDSDAFKCTICDQKLKSDLALKRHVKQLHVEKQEFKCDNCNATFPTKKQLENHHKFEMRQFQCHICDKNLESQSKLNTHKSEVHEKPNEACKQCSQCPAKVKNLHNHMFRVHNNQKKAAKRVKCDLCHKEMTQAHFKIHRFVVHQGLKLNYKQDCPICGKAFASKQCLKMHINRVHNNEKSFKCTECEDRFFFSKAAMEIHRNTIHYDLKFECDICGQKLKSKNYLRVHKQTVHEGDKSKCDLCSKEFSSCSNFRRHMNTVHDQQKSYKCDLCNKKFSQSNNLIRHKKQVHNL